MIDLNDIKIGDSIWYKGSECKVLMLRKTTKNRLRHTDPIEIVWYVSLTDVKSYNQTFFGINPYKNPNWIPVNTGEVYWDGLKDDCCLNNAIDFIRSAT